MYMLYQFNKSAYLFKNYLLNTLYSTQYLIPGSRVELMSVFNQKVSLLYAVLNILERKRNEVQHLPSTYIVVESAYWIIGPFWVFLYFQL